MIVFCEEKVDEGRNLLLIKCRYLGVDDGHMNRGGWWFRVNNQTYKVYATVPQIADVFKKAKVKDNAAMPRSERSKTYMGMAQAIKDGIDNRNWIWSSDMGLWDAAVDALTQLKTIQVVDE
jgi:hypothetical protein